MRRGLYAFLLCLIVAGCESISGLSDTTVQALDKLDKVIETKDDLEMQKESRIAIIKKELNGLDPDSPAYLTLRFDTYKRIYDEYIKFNADSAMRYALLKLDYVRDYNITDRDMVWDAYHAVAERYLLSGMYEEAKTLIVELENVSGEHPSHLLHTLYNGLYVRSSNADLRAYYRSRALEERERLYQELPEDHIARWYINGDILLENERPEDAYHFLIAKYEDPELDHEQKAIIAYLIGNAFSVMGKSDDAIRWRYYRLLWLY